MKQVDIFGNDHQYFLFVCKIEHVYFLLKKNIEFRITVSNGQFTQQFMQKLRTFLLPQLFLIIKWEIT